MEFLLLVIFIVMFAAPPVFFIICLVNTIIHARKYKKGEENKTTALTYGIISGAVFQMRHTVLFRELP